MSSPSNCHLDNITAGTYDSVFFWVRDWPNLSLKNNSYKKGVELEVYGGSNLLNQREEVGTRLWSIWLNFSAILERIQVYIIHQIKVVYLQSM